MAEVMRQTRCGTRRFSLPILRLGVLLLLTSTVYAQNAFVRVNQVGYVSSASKRAYLMSSRAEPGATFSVQDSLGNSVYSAAIGPDQGPWSRKFPFVYVLDFSIVTAPGDYRIAVLGTATAASLAFKIDTGSNLYGGALANTLFFYENERDGPNFIPSALRAAPAHLNDQNAKVYFTPKVDDNGAFVGDLRATGASVDASGGWWDAGDYLKFVQTESYTVAMMLVGVRDFPDQMGPGSQASDFTRETKFGLDWLLKMWDDKTQTLYYQVGIGDGNEQTISDHDLWRLPQVDDTFEGCSDLYRYICHRPVFINTAGGAGAKVSPNLAGRMAASFALCYQVYKGSNAGYAAACLLAAEHIFDLADTDPKGHLLTVIPFSFYGETEWRDDLELGATELYFALRGASGLPSGLPHESASYYLRQAARWANAYILGPNDATDTLNLYDVSGLAHFELYRAMALAENPGGLETTPTALLADLKKQLDGAVAQGNSDPFGFGYPWNVYDTTSHGAGLSVMASEYDFLTGTNTYADYGNRWLANILGANAWGTSLIVGDGQVFPHCMQHQVANLAGSLNGTPPVLAGAVVEGPNADASTGELDGMRACPANGKDIFKQFNGVAVYKDFVQSFATVEPAIDLTASSPLAFSWQMVGGPNGTP